MHDRATLSPGKVVAKERLALVKTNARIRNDSKTIEYSIRFHRANHAYFIARLELMLAQRQNTMIQTIQRHTSLTTSPVLAGISLDNDKLVALSLYVAEFREIEKRIANDFVTMSTRLALIKEILGEHFMPFAQQELGLKTRTIQRYLSLHQVMSNRFSHDGRIDIVEVQQFTQGALALLAPETDEDVITEIRTLAKSQKINEETIKQVIASRDADYEARLHLAASEAETATRKMHEAQQKLELETARQASLVARQEELTRRGKEQIAALEADLERAQKQETVVTEKVVEKEVVPEGYVTLAEAIDDATRKLNKAKLDAETAEREASAAQLKADALKSDLRAVELDTQDFGRVKRLLDEVMAALPRAQIEALSNSNPDLKKAFHDTGSALVFFGNSLVAASAA